MVLVLPWPLYVGAQIVAKTIAGIIIGLMVSRIYKTARALHSSWFGGH